MRIAENTKLTLEEKILKLNLFCEKLEAMFNEVKLWTNPELINAKIEALEKSVGDFVNRIYFLEKQFEKINTNVVIVDVKESEIKKLYELSGATIKEIAAYFNVSENMAIRYAHGKVKDIAIKNKIKKFFEKKIEKEKNV